MISFVVTIIVGLCAGCIGAFSNLWVKRIEKRLETEDRNRAIALKIENLAPEVRALLFEFITQKNALPLSVLDWRVKILVSQGLIRSTPGTRDYTYFLADDVAPIVRYFVNDKNCNNRKNDYKDCPKYTLSRLSAVSVRFVRQSVFKMSTFIKKVVRKH